MTFYAGVWLGRSGRPPPPPALGIPAGWRVDRGGYLSEGTLDFLAADAQIGPIVRGAPYSGEGVTTLTQTLSDGTRSNARCGRGSIATGKGARGASRQSSASVHWASRRPSPSWIRWRASCTGSTRPGTKAPQPAARAGHAARLRGGRFGGQACRSAAASSASAGRRRYRCAAAATPTAAWRCRTRLAPEALRRAGADLFLRAYRTRRSRWARSRSMD